jgi:hypothetical protein
MCCQQKYANVGIPVSPYPPKKLLNLGARSICQETSYAELPCHVHMQGIPGIHIIFYRFHGRQIKEHTSYRLQDGGFAKNQTVHLGAICAWKTSGLPWLSVVYHLSQVSKCNTHLNWRLESGPTSTCTAVSCKDGSVSGWNSHTSYIFKGLKGTNAERRYDSVFNQQSVYGQFFFEITYPLVQIDQWWVHGCCRSPISGPEEPWRALSTSW